MPDSSTSGPAHTAASCSESGSYTPCAGSLSFVHFSNISGFSLSEVQLFQYPMKSAMFTSVINPTVIKNLWEKNSCQLDWWQKIHNTYEQLTCNEGHYMLMKNAFQMNWESLKRK